MAPFDVDKRLVVPHNLYLATKYDCHFNIEISSVKAVKYLYKYIYKGSDRALAKLTIPWAKKMDKKKKENFWYCF